MANSIFISANGVFHYDGTNIVLKNAAGSFGALFFGGRTSSDFAIKRQEGYFEFKSGDDTVYQPSIMGSMVLDGYIEMTEQSTSAAPSANRSKIYTRNTGTKTQIVAAFPSGTPPQVAVEP